MMKPKHVQAKQMGRIPRVLDYCVYESTTKVKCGATETQEGTPSTGSRGAEI